MQAAYSAGHSRPRSRGVLHGAAPRVWKNGSGHSQDFWVGTTRFTPACAGKLLLGSPPRMRGNARPRIRPDAPLARGTASENPHGCGETASDHPRNSREATARLIPACAGKCPVPRPGETARMAANIDLANEHSKLRRRQRKDTAAGWPNLPSLARKAFFLPDHARRTVTFMMDNILWPARRTVHIKTI